MRMYVVVSVLLTLSLVLVGGCKGLLGDLSRQVLLRNASSQTLVVYDIARDVPEFSQTLGPGETRKTRFLTGSEGPDYLVAHIEATDMSGHLVYCRDFRFKELEASNWAVEITVGDLRCE